MGLCLENKPNGACDSLLLVHSFYVAWKVNNIFHFQSFWEFSSSSLSTMSLTGPDRKNLTFFSIVWQHSSGSGKNMVTIETALLLIRSLFFHFSSMFGEIKCQKWEFQIVGVWMVVCNELNWLVQWVHCLHPMTGSSNLMQSPVQEKDCLKNRSIHNYKCRMQKKTLFGQLLKNTK